MGAVRRLHPLAIGVLPILALGAEPPNPRTMRGPGRLVDARLLRRVFGVLGPAEALIANAFACRSETRRVGRVGWRGNALLLWAVLLLLPPLARLLGGTVPNGLGWALAALAIPAAWLADTIHKGLRDLRPG